MATSKRERQKAARRDKLERMQREARRRRTIRRSVIVAIIAAVVVGSAALLFSGSTPTTTTTTSTVATTTTTTLPPADQAKQTAANAAAVRAGCHADPYAQVNNLLWKTVPPLGIIATNTYYAHVTTTVGDFVIKLEPSLAPETVNSFVFLARHKYFNCVIFHRVIPGFVIQGGDPTGTGRGAQPGYTLPDELPKAGHPTYPLYSVAMANAGANTGGSQFFIVTGTQGEGLQPAYSLFGQVISGQNVIKVINSEGTPGGTPLVIQRMLTVTISSQP